MNGLKQNQTIKHIKRQSVSRLVTLTTAALLLLLLLLLLLTLTIFHILQFISVPPAYGMVHLLNTSETGTKSYHNSDIISIREHFDYDSAGQLIQGHNMTDYIYSSDLANNSNSKEYNQLTCPVTKEIAIYIHGV